MGKLGSGINIPDPQHCISSKKGRRGPEPEHISISLSYLTTVLLSQVVSDRKISVADP
jgi:hypothetical protein